MKLKKYITKKFIAKWNLSHKKGRKHFIIFNGIIKPSLLYTLTYFILIPFTYDNVIQKLLYENMLHIQYALILMGIVIIGYITSYNFWEYSNDLYTKLNLTYLMENRDEVNIIR